MASFKDIVDCYFGKALDVNAPVVLHCSICRRVFSDDDQLAAHYELVHPAPVLKNCSKQAQDPGRLIAPARSDDRKSSLGVDWGIGPVEEE